MKHVDCRVSTTIASHSITNLLHVQKTPLHGKKEEKEKKRKKKKKEKKKGRERERERERERAKKFLIKSHRQYPVTERGDSTLQA